MTKPTFEEFCDSLKEKDAYGYEYGGSWTTKENPDYVASRFADRLPFENDEPFMYYSWSTGGMSGGNCWGDEARPFRGEDEPDDNVFTRMLEKHGDHISYMKFRKLSRELLIEDSYAEWEYYGNRSEYDVKVFSLKALYNALYGDE